jgi:hypothetical protein
MSDYKVNLVNDEQPSIQEREEKVLKDAGADVGQDNTYKLDLTKTQENAVQEQSTDEVPVQDEPEASQEVVEEVRSSEEPTEQKEEVEQVLELIKEDSDAEKLQVEEQETNGQEANEEKLLQKEEVKEEVLLPENIQKVVDFMSETGGTLEDYVRLNTDYSNVDEKTLLKEYYRQTRSHLDNDEIDFLIEDNFSFDEEVDDDRDIKRKKLAYKEEIAKARGFLDDLKGKYYDEVKLTSRLAPEQKEAVEFYNNYKKEQEELSTLTQKQNEYFSEQTNKLFNEEFKGFDFKVGENKYRFKVSDTQQVKKQQSDINEFLGSFVNEQGLLDNAADYHKALFAAKNADKIANHFYEQGKADAIRQLEAESKNINMDPRKTNEGFIEAGGLKVRAVTGDNSSKLRVKIKN